MSVVHPTSGCAECVAATTHVHTNILASQDVTKKVGLEISSGLPWHTLSWKNEQQIKRPKIERVQTKFLWQQYVAKKQQLDSQNPGHQDETVLWHGTAVDAIPSTCKDGFNRSYCGKNATALGEGVYFAVQVAYSDRNTYSVPDRQGRKHMFQARVLTGMYCQGQGGMRVPPQRDASRHIQFDSVVDNVSGPGMYIIFNYTQAYPEYLNVMRFFCHLISVRYND